MFHEPKISILIPTYRYARYLPETIESVLAQDFEDFEVLISDDASNDGSAEIIQAYASKDRRIHAVVQPINLGMVSNWNWCLSQTQGKYVKFLFGDDRLTSRGALRRHFEMLEANPSATLSVSARRLINDKSEVFGIWDDIASEGVSSGLRVGRSCLLQTKNLIGEPSAVMFRASMANERFDSRYKQIVDLEMWMRLLRRGDLVYTHEPLCDFRCHEAQATVANSRTKLGFSEYVMLFIDNLDHFIPESDALSEEDRRYLFSTLHYAKKSRGKVPGSSEVVASLEPRIDPLTRLRYWMNFRLLRPYINLRLSLHKRLAQDKLEWNFATGWSKRATPPRTVNAGMHT